MTDNSNVLCHCGPHKTCQDTYGLPLGVHAFTPAARLSESSLHPTPDKFLHMGLTGRKNQWLGKCPGCDLGISLFDLDYDRYHVVGRQLDAANHAIAHLRNCCAMYLGTMGLETKEQAAVRRGVEAFLRALDAGQDFPEMPR